MKQKIIVLIGATASGKSEAAVRLAHKINGCVVNADSMQVYRDLPLLTAQPKEEEQQGIPHYLYGILDCYQTSNVSFWLNEAAALLPNLKNPIVTGGTGLYINALVNGMNDIPEVDPAVREKVRNMPIEEVLSLVQEPAFTDPQRLRRALEVQLSTGKSLSWFLSKPPVRKVDADFEIIYLDRPRVQLRERCAQRFLKMLEDGAEEQVRALLPHHPTGGVTKAIGYKEIQAFFNQEITRAKMIDLAVIATRQYAKRQQTWFKHQCIPDKIIHNPLEIIE